MADKDKNKAKDETKEKGKKDENDKDEDDDNNEDDDVVGSPTSKASAPSLSEQSRLRSTSFRHGGPGPSGPLSPTGDGETAADIYRKQAARIDELERQNKRLAKDAADAEKRWQKAEDALGDTRDGADSSELEKLVCALRKVFYVFRMCEGYVSNISAF